MKKVTKENKFHSNCGRESFTCLEIIVNQNSKFIERAKSYARNLVPNVNPGQANTSNDRPEEIVEIDNLAGAIAEIACYDLLVWIYGEEKILKPKSNSSINQIDIALWNNKTIEVRSSCVRNGLDFALFSMDKKNPGQQYFDILGPYHNGYKPCERLKDYYMRVFFECDKTEFSSYVESDSFTFYITGGATMAMMNDPNKYQIKHLLPDGESVDQEAEYRVIPLAKSLDFDEFLNEIEGQNLGLEKRNEVQGII